MQQLRIYTIKQGEMPDWIGEWKSVIVPLRKQFGFELVNAWTADEPERFVWVLRYDGDKSWGEADADYYNSPERKALDPDPARHIDHSEHFLMREVRL